MPEGPEVTTPLPDPDLVTVNAYRGLKVAVTNLALFIRTSHVVPSVEEPQSLDQPMKTEPAAAVAVSLTTLLKT